MSFSKKKFALINEDAAYSVNEKTRLQCWYCTNEYSIATIGQHLSSGCKIAFESKGKNYEKGKQIKKEKQQKIFGKKFGLRWTIEKK